MNYILLLQLFWLLSTVQGYDDLTELLSQQQPVSSTYVTEVIHLDSNGKPLCPSGGERVCATDGETYTSFENNCNLEAHNFKLLLSGKSELTEVENALCNSRDCGSIVCPQIFQPVCAAPYDSVEGTTISNRCEVNRQSCLTNKTWRVLHDGPCGEASSGCPTFCTMEYNPVCAEHNYVVKTFGNDCVLRTAVCNSGTPWKFLYKGECKYKQVSYVVRPNVNPHPYNIYQGAKSSIPPYSYGPNYYQSQPRIPYYPYGPGSSQSSYAGEMYTTSLYDSPCILGNWPVCAAWYGRKRTFSTACEVLRTHEPWRVVSMGPCRAQGAPNTYGTNVKYNYNKPPVQYNATSNYTTQDYGSSTEKYVTATPTPYNTGIYNPSAPYVPNSYGNAYVPYATPYYGSTISYYATTTTEGPTTTESSTTESSTTESSTTESSTTESSTTESSTTESSTTESSTTESSTTESSTTESSTTESSTTESSTTESSTTESSTTESTTTEEPSTTESTTTDAPIGPGFFRASLNLRIVDVATTTTESAVASAVAQSTTEYPEVYQSTAKSAPVYPSQSKSSYPAAASTYNKPCAANTYTTPAPPTNVYKVLSRVYGSSPSIYQNPQMYSSAPHYMPPSPPMQVPYSYHYSPMPAPLPYPMFYPPPPPPPTYPFYYGHYPPSPYASYPNHYAPPNPYPMPSPYGRNSYPSTALAPSYISPQNSFTNYLLERLRSVKQAYENCLYKSSI